MKMKALDSLHVSSVRADIIRPGEEFEVNDGDGKMLADRGLAQEIGGAKAESAPKNKAEPAPGNKAALDDPDAAEKLISANTAAKRTRRTKGS